MLSLKKLWLLNGTALTISVLEVEHFLQIGLLIISTLITLISQVKKMRGNNDQQKENTDEK